MPLAGARNFAIDSKGTFPVESSCTLGLYDVRFCPGGIRPMPYIHAKEPIGTVDDIYDGSLFPDEAVHTFRNIDRLFPTREVKVGDDRRDFKTYDGELSPFKATCDGSLNPFACDGSIWRDVDLYDYFSVNRVTGIVVLKNGELVFEKYAEGNTPQTRWMSMSVAKSITSSLVGVAINDGYIGSVDDPVTEYVSALRGSAYDGVTIKQVLGMNSGVGWDETYTNPKSDRRDLLRAQLAQRPGALLEVMAGLKRVAEPGTCHNYSTGETQVAGEIVMAATGKKLSDYLGERIWQPCGMEQAAYWWLDSPGGNEIAGSGLAATVRDFARFGQFMLEGGRVNGTAVFPEGWCETATTPTTLVTGERVDYGLMWWTPWTESGRVDGIFQAYGIHGQVIQVDPVRNVVVAVSAAQPKPTGCKVIDDMGFIEALARSIS